MERPNDYIGNNASRYPKTIYNHDGGNPHHYPYGAHK